MATPRERTAETTASLDIAPPDVPTPASDEFAAALRDLARPPAVARRIADELAARVQPGLRGEAVLDAARRAQRGVEPAIGEVIEDRYRITEVLGRGGMGVVLEAEQLQTGKRVAIKWMSTDTGAAPRPAAVARFRREARAVARVQHENVVDVYDVAERAGTPFLVMERLRGESLRARLSRGALDWRDARVLMLGVLRGVSAVHRARVVHRDLKPDNIFLCAGEPSGAVTPKVLDFGVAAMRNTEDGLESLTRTGATIGTPAYMPLEQLTGAEVDERADVYALGVVFYEMLTLKLPFASRSSAELAVLQATSSPTRPSLYVASLRGAREQLMLRALARAPQDRYHGVDAFLAALEADGRRRPRALGWYVIAVALVGAVAAGALWSNLAPRRPAPAVHASVVPVAAPPAAPSRTMPARLDPAVPEPPVAPTTPPDPPTSRAAHSKRRALRGASAAPLDANGAREPARSRLEIRVDDF